MGLFSSNKQSTQNSASYSSDNKVTVDGANNTNNGTTADGNSGTIYGAGSMASAGSIGQVSGMGNTVTMQVTDLGATSKALDAMAQGQLASAELAAQAVQSSGALLSGIFSAQSRSTEQLSSALENVKTSDVRVMAIGALALVVGLFFTRRG